MKIIGFIMLEKLQNNPFYMDYFAIKKEYQNQGLGTNALKILKTEIIPELTDEWYNRLFFPIGIDPDNNINLV